ncbi:MAG: adenylate/guanylate cyclase domain-containing protein, partial [Hyphomicrobium sp.]
GVLAPSVQLHADAAAQILAGDVPLRSRLTGTFEAVAAWLVAALAIGLGMRRAPLYGTLATAALATTWLLLSRGMALGDGTLVDPILVPLTAGIGFAASALATSARMRKREAALRARFAQHLAPAIVARIAAAPDLLKLEGETRDVTALFTDIEGFTAMVERSDAKAVVGLLDRYFEGAIDIVVAHGGMVDKLVGDAIHALFNAPLDLDGHPRRAIACAEELLAFTERFRGDAVARSLGLGRTRIGIETGRAVVGDVGSGHKLDYTAHGDAINTAARLEAANKELGSSICVGPGTAAHAEPGTLRPLSLLDVRGRSAPLQVWEPWPADYGDPDKAAYLAASELAHGDRGSAAEAFTMLAARIPTDPVLARTLARLRAST